MGVSHQTTTTTVPPTNDELAFANAVLESVGNTTGKLTSDVAVEIFNRSGLSRFELRDIWGLADADSNGVLAKDELLVALRIMGWVQSGEKFSQSLRDRPGPLPKIQGISLPEVPAESSTAQQIPGITANERQRFHEAFLRANPLDGRLDGDVVREIYMKSDLSYKELSAIWNLVDRGSTGALSFSEFAMGLHLIDSLKSCRLTTVPASIPDHIFDYLESVPSKKPSIPPLKNVYSSPAEASSSAAPQVPRRAASAIPLGSPKLPPKPPPPLRPKPATKPWAITRAQKTEYDADFATLDNNGTGLVPEEVALRFLRKYHLPVDELAHIWDLAAIRNDSYLNSDEFAVAMYLVQDRLAGKDIPHELPKHLMPPSLRSSPGISSPKETPPPFPVPTLYDVALPHRSTQSTSSYFSDREPEVEPGPPLPAKLQSTMSLTFLTENPTSRSRDAPGRRRTSTLGASSKPLPSLKPPLEGVDDDDDPITDLRNETKTLRKQVDTLLHQLGSQNDFRIANETLRKENGDLKLKLTEVETSMASILHQMQSNDNALSDELTREIGRLTRRVGELEQTESQLQQTVGILEVAKRDNALLASQVRDLRSAEATHRVEVEAARTAADEVERENGVLRQRLGDMTKAMSEPGDARSSRELRLLMQDVTRENQEMKEKMREMERSMEAMLLSSRDSGRLEQKRRENRELQMQVQELEQLTAQLQKSNEDSHLQQILVVLTRENEGMKVRIREMQAGAAQVRGEHDARVQDMQRKIDQLMAENSQLKTQAQQARSSRRHEDDEDMSVPPPAYDDNFIPPDTR